VAALERSTRFFIRLALTEIRLVAPMPAPKTNDAKTKTAGRSTPDALVALLPLKWLDQANRRKRFTVSSAPRCKSWRSVCFRVMG
jgi:hypothetical protein